MEKWKSGKVEKWKSRFDVRRALGFVLWALCLVVPVSLVHATVMLPADFEQMVDGSQLIVHGRVLDVRAQTTLGRRNIECLVTVSIIEPLKGQPGPTVVFRIPGGQIGRYRRVMVGAPAFVEGDEVVLFLSGRAPVMPMPFGLSQGVYRVIRDANGRALVTPPLVTAGGAVPERVVRGDPARRPLALDLFSREVRRVAEHVR